MNKVYPIKCQIRAQADDVTRVDVYDDIGGGGWFSDGISAADFTDRVQGVKGALEVHINSGGGDVFDGIAIHNAIRDHKGNVTTVVDSLAASIASVIAQAGDERVVKPGAMLMVHDAWGQCIGDAAEMAKMAGILDKNSDNIAGIYAKRAGGTTQGWRDTMREEAWYTADEATAAGLADRVGSDRAELPAGIDLAAYEMPGRIMAALRSLPHAAAPAAPAPSKTRKPGPLTAKQIRAIIREELAAAQAGGHMCGDACGPGCSCATGSTADQKTADDHHDAGLAWSGPDRFRASLERKDK